MNEISLTVGELVEVYEFVKKLHASDKDFYNEHKSVILSYGSEGLTIEVPLLQFDTLGTYKTVIFGDSMDPFGETV